MIYANKKINQSGSLAEQTAKIITNVIALESKRLIRLTDDTVFVNRQLWKDKANANNWISCLHQYYVVKRSLRKSGTLYFKDMHSDELIGTRINGKSKVLIFS